MKSIDCSVDEARAAILSAENGVDAALAGLHATFMRVSADRTLHGLDAVATQKVHEDGAELILGLVQNRRGLVRLHDNLARTAVRHGATASGPTEKPHDGDMPPPGSGVDGPGMTLDVLAHQGGQ